MAVILFMFAEAKRVAGKPFGIGPSWQGRIPLPGAYLRIFGVTLDSTGTALPGCIVHLFQTADDKFIDQAVSDGSGNYEFRSPSLSTAYYVVAYKAGSPDVVGATINTLVGS